MNEVVQDSGLIYVEHFFGDFSIQAVGSECTDDYGGSTADTCDGNTPIAIVCHSPGLIC